jgi:N-acetylglucosaminyldiphosphoundecaprenol N-acetyl-beta-D-mannosaminyltransferase
LALLKKYPSLIIYGENIDPKSRQSPVISHQNTHNVTDYRLPMTDCSILFCNFGAPAQEKFLNSQKNGNIRLAMGVGGSFDFMTGKIKRAPYWMQLLGLEWLFRLIQEPRYRLLRIIRAVIIFPLLVIINKE